MSLCYTNVLVINREYTDFFSEISFHKTLKDLIACGEYNKTKKRSTPMYCYGSTITCTRYPKFFWEGKPRILPRPYFSSKPNQDGYNIIRTVWFQAFLEEVESHVLHYLHNILTNRHLRKITLFKIKLSKTIIPECLRLGNSFFTHMSVFGTLNKEDGAMPIHFDGRDVISCVFHLGNVTRGGSTCYYSGKSPNSVGDKVYEVPFEHGRLQIGFFNKILHGVQDWDGQRCGIQFNIKKDVLAHFIKFGSEHYNKYKMSRYPQGPIVLF